MAFISSATPTPVFVLVKKMGINVPAATDFESAAEISSGVSCAPSRYRSISASSASTMASIIG